MNKLERFDEGQSHEKNPLGGIPIGSNNTVEEGETKFNDFVFSDRIKVDKNLIDQFKLPSYIKDKTYSQASKSIDDKFKDRNDKYSNETKSTLLSRLSEAHEYTKMQESLKTNSTEVPDMMNGEVPQGFEEFLPEQNQMFLGGNTTNTASTSGMGMSILQGAGAMGNAMGEGNFADRYNYDPKLKANYLQMEKAKDGIAGAIPVFGGLFRGIEKAGKGIGTAVGGETGGDVASGILDPFSGQMETLKSKDSTQFEKGLSLAAPFLSGVIASKGRARGQAKIDVKNSLIKSNQFTNDFALGGNLNEEQERPKRKGTYKDSLDAYNRGENNKSLISASGNMITHPFDKNDIKDGALDKESLELYRRTGILPSKEYVGKFRSNTGSTPYRYGYERPNGDKPKETIQKRDIQKNINLNPESLKELESQEIISNFNLNPQYQPTTFNLSESNQRLNNTTGYGSGRQDNTADIEKALRAKEYTDKYNEDIEMRYNNKDAKKNKKAQDRYNVLKNNLSITPNEMAYGGPIRNPNEGTLDDNLLTADLVNQYNNQPFPNGVFKYNTPIDNTVTINQSELDNPGFNVEQPYTNNKLGKANLKPAVDWAKNNYGNIMRLAPVAANAYQLANLKKPNYERLNRLDSRYKADYVDERSLQNIANSELNNISNSLTSATNGSAGALRASLLGASLNRNKALSDAYLNASNINRQQNQTGQEFNLNIDRTNLSQSNMENDINTRNQASYENNKSKLISQLGNDVGAIGKEEVYKKIASTAYGYNWLGEYIKQNPNAKPEEIQKAYEEQIKTTKSKAFGGFLKRY